MLAATGLIVGLRKLMSLSRSDSEDADKKLHHSFSAPSAFVEHIEDAVSDDSGPTSDKPGIDTTPTLSSSSGTMSPTATLRSSTLIRNIIIYLFRWSNLTIYSAKAIIVSRRIIWSWYTGCWSVNSYIWYSEEETARGRSPPSPLLAVPNVTAHPSTASVPITVFRF